MLRTAVEFFGLKSLATARVLALSLALFTGSQPHHAFAQDAGAGQETSPQEAALNAFGDPWRLAKPNPSIALAGATACYRKPPEERTAGMSQEEIGFQSALATAFVVGGCAAIIDLIRRS